LSGTVDGKSLVLSAVDIVGLVGQSVKLKRAGKDYVGLCPFHNEKTPSFHVVPSKQIFHCFGCKATGNAIDFVIKRDRVEFRDALRTLAEQYGVTLPKLGRGEKGAGERQGLLEACSAASAQFEAWLKHAQMGKAARDYLEKRGFDQESVRRFNIGFAPDSWDSLSNALTKKFPASLLQQAGLLKARESGSGHYDVFRNRLMFPIRDETGRTIAFGGRIMPGPEADKTAKYLNSPETPLFHKGRAVFGLDLAKQAIIESRTVAVVEGYTDVVMAHQHGAANVVSILGTAMTESHVALLRRFAERIVLLFDADAAGESAVNRTVELFLTQPIDIAIATIPDGLDPDEFIIERGVKDFRDLLDSAIDALTYKWRSLRASLSAAEGLTGEQKAVSAYLDLLVEARKSGPVDEIRWGAALSRVSKLTDIPVEQLYRRFGASRPGRRTNTSTVTDVSHEASPVSPATASPRRTDPAHWTARDRAERWILGGVLSQPDRWAVVQTEVSPDDFTEEARQQLAAVFWEVARDDGHVELKDLLGLLPGDGLKELAVTLVQEVEALADIEQSVKGAVESIRASRARTAEAVTFAKLRRSPEVSTEPADELALLVQLQDQARRRACGEI
jgi:DNA primase